MLHARTDYQRIQDPALEDSNLLGPGSTPIGQDEPVLLFRAQDRHAPAVAKFYAQLLEADSNVIMEEAVLAQERRMLEWQQVHGSKSPDMPTDAILS